MDFQLDNSVLFGTASVKEISKMLLTGRQSKSTRRVKMGVFFSHPTQHHSPMFRYLSRHPALDVKIYYYDPIAGMQDPGFAHTEVWDVDLLTDTNASFLPNWLRGSAINTLKQLNPRVVSVMLRYRFNAVFFSGYVTPSNWLVLAIAKLLGSKILYQSDTNILDEQRKRRNRLQTLLRKLLLSNVDTILAIGNKNKEFYLACGIPEERIIWCPYPVEVERYMSLSVGEKRTYLRAKLRVDYNIPDTSRVIVFCGKLIPRKRPQDLIEALRLLDRKDVYALLIGSGAMEEELKASLRNTDRVRLSGFINQSAMPELMAGADIGVVTSEWDPHPLVTTELAACGLPVIVSHYTGVWGENDILRPGKNGLVYPCGDVSALAECLAKLLDNEPLRNQMAINAKHLASLQSAHTAAQIIASQVIKFAWPS